MTPPKLDPFLLGCRNCSKSEQFRQQISQPLSKLFIQSIFYLQIYSLFCLFVCLVLFTVLSGCVPFLVFFTVLSGLEDFFCRNYPRSEQFWKKRIFNYKGLDIKLLNIKLLNYIRLDFLYTARFGWNLSFPCSFLRKIQKTSKNLSNIPSLMVQVSPLIFSLFLLKFQRTSTVYNIPKTS